MLAACSFDGSAPAGSNSPDASTTPDAPISEGGSTHLLISEVKTRVIRTEFIEIYNPLNAPVVLKDYYLSDTSSYARTPEAFAGDRPIILGSDFVARFPEDASISPGEALVVGLRPSDFFDAYGRQPDFSISGDEGEGQPMRSAFEASIGFLPGITDSGEAIVLFYWDGSSDLVQDIDIVRAGDDLGGFNSLRDKSDRDVDGPDDNDDRSSYQTDSLSMPDMSGPTSDAGSYQRRTGESAGLEVATGGNGVSGHDETSESIRDSWEIADVASPGTVPSTVK